MLITESFHQRSCFPVVVSRHGGEKAAELNERVIIRLCLRRSLFPLFKLFPCPSPKGKGSPEMGSCETTWPFSLLSDPYYSHSSPHSHTHWCSIWKFKCPVNQSLNKDWFTLHVAWSWEEKKKNKHKEIHDLTFFFSGSLIIEPQQSLPTLV